MDTAVAIGNFDGVHLGHQAVLAETQRRADRRNLKPIALTFDVPPRCLASPDDVSSRPGCILSPAKIKSSLLRQTVRQVVSVPFSSVRGLDPETFVLRILVGKLHAAAVIVGDDFRFGAARAGDVGALRRMLPTGDVVSVAAVCLEKEPISSSRIRTCLRKGRIEEASALLGRFPVYAGPVDRGDGIGRQLGAPTINLRISEETLVPPDGVYASWCFAAGRGFPAAAYVGSRPTFRQTDRRFEVHLLGIVPPTIRPPFIEVHLISRMRPDHRFSSQHALQQQIRADLTGIEQVLEHPFQPPRAVLG